MHMVTALREQTIAQDSRKIARNGAVVQRGRRLGGDKFEINRNTVALLRSNTGAALVEGEALLVVASYDFIELGAGERKAVPGTCLEQIRNVHPAAGLELKSQSLRLVA
jgi:hypothetical protein